MAFVQKQTVNGKPYYQYVKSYRQGKKVKVRVVCNLGRCPSLQDALNDAKRMQKEERIRRFYREGRRCL